MKRSPITHLVAAVIAAFAILTGLLTTAAPANAAMYWGASGKVYVHVHCQDSRITIAPSMSVQEGFTGGQYMVWRFHIDNGKGYASTSSWSGSKPMPFSVTEFGYTTGYYLYPHTPAAVATPRNSNWRVLVQVGYWQGSRYTYTGWYDPHLVTANTRGYVSSGFLTMCLT